MHLIEFQYLNIKEIFPSLLSEEMEIVTQTLNSSSKTNELRFRQEPEPDTPVFQRATHGLNLRSVNERKEQPTDRILRRREDLCALLACRVEGESDENTEESGSRHNQESNSPSCDWYDSNYSIK